MPQDNPKLEQLLLQRPPKSENPTPMSFDDPISRFFKGMFGEEQIPKGDIAGAVGGAASVLPLGRFAKAGVGVIDKVSAPKRAAKELVDLLLGRSKRVPTPKVWQPMTDKDASLVALRNSRIGVRPLPPTTINMGEDTRSLLTGPHRTLPRDPAASEAYRRLRPFQNANARKTAHAVVSSVPGVGSSPPNYMPPAAKPTRSIQESGVKVMTEQEMRGLIEGPKEALKRGLITAEEAQARIKAGQEKINAYLASTNKVDNAVSSPSRNAIGIQDEMLKEYHSNPNITLEQLATKYGYADRNSAKSVIGRRKTGPSARTVEQNKAVEARHNEIRKALAAGESGYSIAKRFGLSKTQIYKIKNKSNGS